jgi:parvulin-like peptidyl-prolyl isomerase
MEISDIAEIGDSYYLIQVIEEQPEQIPPLEDVKEEVREIVAKAEQEKATQQAAGQFLEAARTEGSISSAAQDAGVEVKTVTLANRKSPPPPELENEASVVQTAFNLSEMNKLPENPVQGQKGYYAIELKERMEPASEGFANFKTMISKQLISQKQTRLFNSWVEDLRKNSDIEIEERILDQTRM